MMFQEGISFWKCYPGSFFNTQSGSNETSTEFGLVSGRPWRRRWMPCGSCDTRVSYASSVPAYNLRCCWWLRTGGCHGAPREAVKNWVAWVFCSQKTWDSLRKVWRTFALPCGILSWISQGKMLESENGHTKYTKILVFVGIFHGNSPCGTPQRPNKNAFAFRLRPLSQAIQVQMAGKIVDFDGWFVFTLEKAPMSFWLQ